MRLRALGLVTLAALLWLGARGLGPVPPLGPVLDPARGAWALARSAEWPRHAEARIPGLRARVRVVYDDRGVPHIFATSELDAWRALGYVTARDRLFQLELQARAGGGTLAELIGPAALPLDQETRRLGMGRAAERIVAALPDTGEVTASIDAYAAGINTYIEALPEGELPLEYRLLGRRPARWTRASSIQVQLRMGYTLAQSDEEMTWLRAAAAVGDAAASALFPQHAAIQEPIQPSVGGPRTLPVTLPPPGPPDPARAVLKGMPLVSSRSAPDDTPDLGSNNWAVAPGRTRDGVALLAGDPHLELTLPSIWYEAHLVVPGSLDVYGVAIPGLPAIALGFTRAVAWAATNTGADVMDWWRETVDDTLRPRRYLVDGAWMPIELRVERYDGAHGELLATDTLRFTHRGPLRHTAAGWLSMRWTVLEGGVEGTRFQRAARARTAREWLDAMAGFLAPAQNLLVADTGGAIAIRSTGRFPIRPDGRGDRLHDGTTRASDWDADWSVADYPHAFSPTQGFLASANQEPEDPREAPRYLGAEWPSPWRALRINGLLRRDSAVTVETMRQWQTDPGSTRADRFLPYLVRAGAGASDSVARHAATILGRWDGRYTTDNEAAILFEAVMPVVTQELWDELPSGVTPGVTITSALLDQPDSPWWDRRSTPERERRDDVLREALRTAYRATMREFGVPGSSWRWGRVHRITIWHLLRLPSLSANDISVPGGPGTLSPSSMHGAEGPSWRMVVELGRTVRAWGVYPGGQSGNPASARYDDRIALWRSGKLAELRFPHRPEDVPPRAELTLDRLP